MFDAIYLKVAAVIASGSLLVLMMFRSICKHNDNTGINQILFFGDRCPRLAKRASANNIMCISIVLFHAERSIDVCMPRLVNPSIANCLIRAKNKAIVRVFIHNSEDFTQLQVLAANGIQVKVMNHVNEHLAHEFILVDAWEDSNVGIAVIGSIDYGAARVNLNTDSTMITSEKAVVNALKKEFERIWTTLPSATVLS